MYITNTEEYFTISQTIYNTMLEMIATYPLPEFKMNLCVDLGSNLGCFINYAHDKFNRIVGFEASLNNAKISDQLLYKNNVHNFYIHNLAVGKKSNGCARLYPNETKHCGDNSIKMGPFKEGQFENVLKISLEDIFNICQTDFIDYMKVDIEGSEYNLFLDKDIVQNIAIIIMEIHGEKNKDRLLLFLEKYFVYKSRDNVNFIFLNKKFPLGLSCGRIFQLSEEHLLKESTVEELYFDKLSILNNDSYFKNIKSFSVFL